MKELSLFVMNKCFNTILHIDKVKFTTLSSNECWRLVSIGEGFGLPSVPLWLIFSRLNQILLNFMTLLENYQGATRGGYRTTATSKMERFVIIVYGFQLHLGCCSSPGSVSGYSLKISLGFFRIMFGFYRRLNFHCHKFIRQPATKKIVFGDTFVVKITSPSQHFKHQPHKMAKHTQTIYQLLPTNCLSAFDHFVGLVLKGLSWVFLSVKNYLHIFNYLGNLLSCFSETSSKYKDSPRVRGTSPQKV